MMDNASFSTPVALLFIAGFLALTLLAGGRSTPSWRNR